MNDARAPQLWRITSAVLFTVLIAWTAAPTYPFRWAGSDGASGTNYYGWWEPIVFGGSAAFHAPLVFICAIGAAGFAWRGVISQDDSRAPVWWALVAVALLIGWPIVLRAFSWQEAVALALLLGGVLAAVLSRSSRRG